MKTFGVPTPGINYVTRPGSYALLLEADKLAVVATPMGVFLPGGGADPGEDPLDTLRRELHEEIGFGLAHAEFLFCAAQYHWSEFYQTHFHKIGTFYRISGIAPASPKVQAEHQLLWLPPDEAGVRLTQEFQRWAVTESKIAR